MNDACELIQDDLAAYALGSLDPPAVQAVEAHLATCANCRATLEEYQQVATLLPLGLPLAQPTVAERSSLLARVKAQPAARPAVPARAPRPRLFARPWSLRAALLLLILGL